MRRPIYILLAFVACLTVVLSALVWVSVTAVRLDRAERDARVVAAVEENVRLALWRMDSKMAAFIAAENSRPYFHYSAFYNARDAYTRTFRQYRAGDVLMPSPLLAQMPLRVLLYFQFSPDGELTSPQVPPADMLAVAEGNFTTAERVRAAQERFARLSSIVDRAAVARLVPEEPKAEAITKVVMKTTPPDRVQQARQMPAQQVEQQISRSNEEWLVRSQNIADNTSQAAQAKGTGALDNILEGVLQPFWVKDELILVRRVRAAGGDHIQGCWLDWAEIRDWLLEDIRDLFPQPGLNSVTSPSADRSRMLASLPVELVPGPSSPTGDAAVSPVLYSLFVAWIAVLLATAAAAWLLWAAVSLSARRGAFVSAVTHELRTPLTTFSLYTEMLSEGMVPEEKRKAYLETLRSEADRLSHLVENVLAYARVENRAATSVETVTVGELLDKIIERLRDRAAQAGMDLVVESDATDALTVRVDRSAVERILFNLVDNASKYACHAGDKRVHLSADSGDGFALLRVRDHGPGIPAGSERRVFRHFSKSARDAANSAPGVGLGLSLSRRLARSLGGDLRLDRGAKDGACFVLSLPLC